MSEANPTRVNVYGRLAFPALNKPEKYKGEGTPRFSAVILIDETSPDVAKVDAAMKAAAKKQWGEKAEAAFKALKSSNKVAVTDGNNKSEVAGFAGHIAVSAHAKETAPPRLVVSRGGRNEAIDRESQTVFFGGCYVNAIVDFWAQDNQFGKRINAQLAGLQFVKAGEPFGGGRPASEDDFEVVESAEADDFDTF